MLNIEPEYKVDPDFKLDHDQEVGINAISRSLVKNQSVLAVSPGGSGKTVIFSTITYRFCIASTKDVLILVDREELLDQARDEIYGIYGIVAQKIVDSTKIINRARVTIAMVETFNNRAKVKRFLECFGNVGLVILDEAHKANFNKIFHHFILAKRIGFTATPIAANKREPLNKYYQDIIIISTPTRLILLNQQNPERGIVPSRAYSFAKVNRSDFKLGANGEYNEDAVGEEFSKKYQIENTLKHYIEKGIGKKTLCFNANIKHSLKMHNAFLESGFNSRHLDGNKNGEYGNDSYRKDCKRWLKLTPNAILNNVGVLTTGFNERSIETIIINSIVGNIAYFIQKAVRGARPFKYSNGLFKEDYLLLDMGNNILDDRGKGFGDCNNDIDWVDIFWNPKLIRDGAIGVVKKCPECGAILAASARICTAKVYDVLEDDYINCDYIFPMQTKEEDDIEREMIAVGQFIDVSKTINHFSNYKEYYSMYKLIEQIANVYRKKITGDYLDSLHLSAIINLAHSKVSEWFKLKGIRKYPNFKLENANKMIMKLKEVGFNIPVDEIQESLDY